MINYPSAAVIKVAHHGSMHNTPLDIYEKINPSLAIISTKQEPSTKKLQNTAFPGMTRNLFPHQSAITALEESDIRIITTDGSYEGQLLDNGNKKDADNENSGSIVVVIPPKGNTRWKKLTDSPATMAMPPTAV